MRRSIRRPPSNEIEVEIEDEAVRPCGPGSRYISDWPYVWGLLVMRLNHIWDNGKIDPNRGTTAEYR